MKKCFFYFLSFFFSLGLVFTATAHAAEVDGTDTFVAVAKLEEFVNPAAPLELWFQDLDGSNPIQIYTQADLFRSGYFDILPLPPSLDSIPEKSGCAESVNYSTLYSGGNTARLTMTRAHVRIIEGDIRYISIEAVIHYRYLHVEDGMGVYEVFKPRSDQFRACPTLTPGTPLGTLPGAVSPAGTIHTGGGDYITPGARIDRDPVCPPGAVCDVPDDDAEAHPVPPATDGDPVLTPPEHEEGTVSTDTPPAGGEAVVPPSTESSAVDHTEVSAQTPSVPQAQGAVGTSVPNYLQGGCSLGGAAGYGVSDALYGLLTLLTTIPLFGRRKK